MVWVQCQTQQLGAGGLESGGSLGLDHMGILISLALHSFSRSKWHGFLLCGMLIRRYGSGFPSQYVFGAWHLE